MNWSARKGRPNNLNFRSYSCHLPRLLFLFLVLVPASVVAQGRYFLGYTDRNEAINPNFSPDGKFVAFLHREETPGESSLGLFLVELSRPDVRKKMYSAKPGEKFRQFWFSRESSSLVYGISGSDSRLVYVSIPNLEQIRLTPPHKGTLTFSAGYRQDIVYSEYLDGDVSLFRVATDGTGHVALTSDENVWQFYSRSDRDWVLYSTRDLGRITRIQKTGEQATVLADLGEGDPIFSIAANGENIVFTRTSYSVGSFLAYRNFFHMNIDGKDQFQLSNTIGATARGWLDGYAGTYGLAGHVLDEEDAQGGARQILQFEFQDGNSSLVTLPDDVETHPPMWLWDDGRLLFGVGSTESESKSLYWTEAIWSATKAGHMEEVVAPLGHYFSYHVVGEGRDKIVILPYTNLPPYVEPYIDLIDLAQEDKVRLSNARSGYCHALGGNGMLIVGFSEPEDLSSHFLRYLDLETREEVQVQTATEEYSTIRLLHHCSSPYNSKLYFYQLSTFVDNTFSGQEQYLVGFPFPEAPLLNANFESSPTMSHGVSATLSSDVSLEAEPKHACVPLPSVECPAKDQADFGDPQSHSHPH